MANEQRTGRQKAVSDLKRGFILDAAREVFETDGLDGASLRAIAAAAGYTPAALYFHFESKEAIYAEVLRGSLARLGQSVSRAILRTKAPADRLRAAAMAFFCYYESALHPIADAARALGARSAEAKLLMVDTFAHAAGLLLLAHTRRIRMFGASAPDLMERFVESAIAALTEKQKKGKHRS